MIELAIGLVGLLSLLSVLGISILFLLAVATAVEKFCEKIDEENK